MNDVIRAAVCQTGSSSWPSMSGDVAARDTDTIERTRVLTLFRRAPSPTLTVPVWPAGLRGSFGFSEPAAAAPAGDWANGPQRAISVRAALSSTSPESNLDASALAMSA
ncbi:MAG: hypothetical protein HY048_05320 [Acidobacteria bacterium]|nr:hypothetical protein [Acidobacteriota bacterium]